MGRICGGAAGGVGCCSSVRTKRHLRLTKALVKNDADRDSRMRTRARLGPSRLSLVVGKRRGMQIRGFGSMTLRQVCLLRAAPDVADAQSAAGRTHDDLDRVEDYQQQQQSTDSSRDATTGDDHGGASKSGERYAGHLQASRLRTAAHQQRAGEQQRMSSFFPQSTFFGLDLMSTSLQSFSVAENVTGDNISNVNTPGATQQQAVLTEAPPIVGSPFTSTHVPGTAGRRRDRLADSARQRRSRTTRSSVARVRRRTTIRPSSRSSRACSRSLGDPNAGVSTAFTNFQTAVTNSVNASASGQHAFGRVGRADHGAVAGPVAGQLVVGDLERREARRFRRARRSCRRSTVCSIRSPRSTGRSAHRRRLATTRTPLRISATTTSISSRSISRRKRRCNPTVRR